MVEGERLSALQGNPTVWRKPTKEASLAFEWGGKPWDLGEFFPIELKDQVERCSLSDMGICFTDSGGSYMLLNKVLLSTTWNLLVLERLRGFI